RHRVRPRARPPRRRRGAARRDVPAGWTGSRRAVPHPARGLLRSWLADRASAADQLRLTAICIGSGSSSMKRFEGRTAVVTGGAEGIGLATAERLHAEGASVFIADIKEWEGSAASQRLARGGRIAYRRTDASIAAEVEAMMAAAEDEFGAIDVLVSNVGVA